jgi:hypothetical protein
VEPELFTLPEHRFLVGFVLLDLYSFMQGRIQDFKLGGVHLKKLRRMEGGAKNFGVFRVKHHDFTPKNYIFSNCGGTREHFFSDLTVVIVMNRVIS